MYTVNRKYKYTIFLSTFLLNMHICFFLTSISIMIREPVSFGDV